MSDRAKQLRQQMARQELAVFLVDKSESIRWLSGYTGEDHATLLVTARQKFLLITNGSFQQAQQEAPDWQVISLFPDARRIISGIFKTCRGRRLGFEDTMPYGELALFKKLDRNNRRHYICTVDVVRKLRLVKTPAEIKCLRRACRLADDGFRFACRILRPGITEAELSWQIERYLRDRGADQRAFRFVVGFGANSSSSHHEATSRRLKAGDIIMLDYGVKYQGFVSDITRTVFFGPPDRRLGDIYQRVYQSQRKALALLRPGITAWAVHRLVEQKMREDHKWVLPHCTGHGFGLEVHELPYFGSKKVVGTNIPLRPNMTFTIEPGIYLPGKGGVRIEDDILMTEHGYELLTHSPKKLEEIIIQPRRER